MKLNAGIGPYPAALAMGQRPMTSIVNMLTDNIGRYLLGILNLVHLMTRIQRDHSHPSGLHLWYTEEIIIEGVG